MKEIIILKSRDGSTNYLKKLEGKTYLLNTELGTVRTGSDEEGIAFVDPSGGPMLAKGMYLDVADATIKSIDHLKGQGFTITFK